MTGSENGPMGWNMLCSELLGEFFLFPRVSDNAPLPLPPDLLVHGGEMCLFIHVSEDRVGWHQEDGRGMKLDH